MRSVCSLLVGVVAPALCVSLAQPAFAGSIVAWGGISFDSEKLAGNDFVAIAAGGGLSAEGSGILGLALKSDGSISAWGDTDMPPVGNDFVAIAACDLHCLALKSDGSIVGWEGKDNGTPPAGNDFVAIAAGEYHNLALKSDGSIVGWGRDYHGETKPPEGNDFVAIAAGECYSLALKSDGSIVGWGCNWEGQATPPEGNDFVAITAGLNDSLALKSDGSIVAWGDNRWNTPPEGNDFVAIVDNQAAWGHYHLALKSDGTIVGWPNESDGRFAPPAGNDFVAIAAGFEQCLAIRETGPRELILTNPNPGESLIAGTIHTSQWESSGGINQVLIEYSDSNGVSWSSVSPPNAGNNRRYNWLVPKVNSQECLIRITDAADAAVSDASDATFTIYQCTLKADLTGDCLVDMRDFALLASEWLQCGNPFDPDCLP